jgi:hypothetical protein
MIGGGEGARAEQGGCPLPRPRAFRTTPGDRPDRAGHRGGGYLTWAATSGSAGPTGQVTW